MRSGLERFIDHRSREWKLLVPKTGSFDEAGRQKRDEYFRVIEPPVDEIDFQGFDVPLQELRGAQHDIGHITRGDRHLFVTQAGTSDLSSFRPGLAVVDVFGVQWGIVSVEDWTGKVLPNSDHDSSFLRMQITRTVQQ